MIQILREFYPSFWFYSIRIYIKHDLIELKFKAKNSDHNFFACRNTFRGRIIFLSLTTFFGRLNYVILEIINIVFIGVWFSLFMLQVKAPKLLPWGFGRKESYEKKETGPLSLKSRLKNSPWSFWLAEYNQGFLESFVFPPP